MTKGTSCTQEYITAIVTGIGFAIVAREITIVRRARNNEAKIVGTETPTEISEYSDDELAEINITPRDYRSFYLKRSFFAIF